MAKLRVTISDDPKHQPAGVRVVGRQRFGWVALVGAFAALLCLPAFRHLMLDQAHVVTTGRAPEWLSGITGASGIIGNPTTDAYRARLRSTLEKHPEDVDLHLGAVVLALIPPPANDSNIVDQKSPTWNPRSDRDPRLVYLNGLRRRYPGDVRVLATCLRYYSQNSIRVMRSELLEWGATWPKETKLLDSSVASEVLALIEEGERADPENAYFPTMAAATYVGAGEDSKAEEALHRAAACQVWKDYSWAEGSGAERLLTLAYGDRGLMMRAMPLAAILLPHFSSIRASYRVLIGRAGPAPEGWQLRYDMVKVGALMREGGETLIARLVGAAIQEIAFDTDRVKSRGGHTVEEMEDVKRQRNRELLTRAEREAPAVAPLLSREADRLAAFRAKRDRIKSVGAMFGRIMRPAIQRELLGLHVLGNLLGCLALWAGTAAIALVGSKVKMPGAQSLSERLPRPAFIGLVALSIAALMILLGAAGVSPANAPLNYGFALFWLIFAVRPLLMRPGAAAAWQPAVIGGLAAAAFVCTLSALWPWEFATHPTQGYWMRQLRFLHLLWESPEQPASSPMGFALTLGPAPIVAFICVCTVLAMLGRRGMFLSWIEGTRGVARVLTAVLAVGYLVFTLVHAPATLRDGRIASQNFRNETAILDQR